MNQKKVFGLFGSVILAGGILAGCSSSEGTEEVEQAPADQQQEQVDETNKDQEVSVETSVTFEQVSAYKAMNEELGKAKEGQQVDWEVVANEYAENLRTAVTESDGELDQAITAAIEGGKNGELDANLARQLIDKTTQSYFYKKQKSLYGEVTAAMEAQDQAAAELAFEEVKHLFNEVIIPTAVKRDGYYELQGEDSMEQSINAGLTALEEAFANGNVDDFSVYKQITDKTAYRSLYLASLSYAEKIEKAVAEGETDQLKLQNMQAEAWGFFQAIKGSLSGGNEEAANELNKLFTLFETDPTTIKAATVSDLFTKAFVGKITGYHEKAPKDIQDGDLTKARAHALEGNVFMQDIKLVLLEKLGEEKTAELFENAQKWYDAIAQENLEEAATYSGEIVPVLEGLVK